MPGRAFPGRDGLTLLVRTSETRSDLPGLVRAKVLEADPTTPLYLTATMKWKFDDLLTSRRGTVLVLSALAGLALVLSTVGIFGVLAYDVSQRKREIGIRGALGATRAQILGLVVRQGLWRTGIGLGIGLIGALGLSRLLASLLFDVHAYDPLTYVGVPLLFLGVAFVACYLPARRAAKVDPVVALRCE